MELSQAISQAIKEFGKDIITEPRFVNILADYDAFAESRQMRMVVKDMVEQGFTKRLASFDSTFNDINERINSFAYEAINLFPFREDLVTDFISATLCCINALECKLVNRTSESQVKNAILKETSSVYFEISEDGKILIKASQKLKGRIVIPHGIEVISEEAFYKNVNITEVFVPEGVKKIDRSVFCGCSKLTYVQLPESLVEIQDRSFFDCFELKKLFLPKNVKEIGICLCNGHVDVDKSNISFKSIDGAVLSKNGQVLYYVPHDQIRYVVPEGVIKLNYCFMYCTNLKVVSLPHTLRYISPLAFNGCESLVSVETKESLESIGFHAFCSCDALKELVIPERIAKIDRHVFSYSGIKVVKIKSRYPERIEWEKYEKNGNGTYWGILKNDVVFQVPQIAIEKYKRYSQFKDVKLVSMPFDIMSSAENGQSGTFENKTKEDFCHIENIILGETTWGEAESLGYEVVELLFTPCRLVRGKYGSLWDIEPKGYFNLYTISGILDMGTRLPDEWTALGLKHDLSYNEFVSLFKNWGFSISNDESCAASSAKLIAESFDRSIVFTLDFDFGTTNGSAALAKHNSLCSIKAKT